MYKSINPATEETLAQYPSATKKQIDESLSLSWDVFQSWRKTEIGERLKLVRNLKEVFLNRKDQVVKLITSEMGKTINDAGAEFDRVSLFCDYALENAESILSIKEISNPMASAYVEPNPLGVIFGITPWNVPFATPFRTILPSIVCGNSVIIKPAPNVAGCALLAEEIFLEAGFPKGLVQILLLENEDAESLIGDLRVRKISFVGSSAVGAHLASIAGKSSKPILVELGGSDPFIVLKDADIEIAAMDAAAARCTNAGQVCCSSKRIIVEDQVYDDFCKLFINAMQNKRVGDPEDSASDYGPLARADILSRLEEQLKKAIASGCRVLLNGGRKEGRGYFFTPVVLEERGELGFSTNEEFFGPIASLFRARDAEHAIQIANSSSFGLGSAIYSKNVERAKQLASSLEVGFTYINRKPGLHPYIPFGGVKNSGYGKDCGEAGYLEFLNLKSIVC